METNMDSNLTTAIVSAGATALVAIVALIQNSKRLEDMGKRFDDMAQRIGRVEKQLELIQSDLKEFFRTLAELDKRVQRLEDKQ
jgi:predicted nuclease with TOPRIM domain